MTATSPAVSRSERRKARTESQILSSAEELFLDRGFAETRIEDVAAAADVAVGSIYTYFGSKLRLYLTVVERALSEQEAALGEVFASEAPPRQRLERLGAAYVEFVLAFPERFQLLNEAAQISRGPRDDGAKPLIRDLRGRGTALVTALEELIAEGVASGSLRAVDPARTARYLWGSWTGVLELHLRRDRLGTASPDELRAIVDVGVDILRHGMRRSDTSSAADAPPGADDANAASPTAR